MFIRYQTVRNAAILVLVVAAGGLAYSILWKSPPSESTLPAQSRPLTSGVQIEPEIPRSPEPSDRAITSSHDVPGVGNHLNRNSPPAEPPTKSTETIKPTVDWMQEAMQIATGPVDKKSGKDVLGPKSPWKLNLYDDDGDGSWDRGKLDTNRDDVDDEKWNYKEGRWEREGGNQIWDGARWMAIETPDKPAASVPSPPASTDAKALMYREAMKIATSGASGQKGKDVLGSKHPWKLNLYDDDGNGRWDRGKLDTNRDEVDDEKWNFKNGRWEKDGGSLIWNGENWVAG